MTEAENRYWRALMWNVITLHPEIQDAEVLFSKRNEIARYVIDQADTEIQELVRQLFGARERWTHDRDTQRRTDDRS